MKYLASVVFALLLVGCAASVGISFKDPCPEGQFRDSRNLCRDIPVEVDYNKDRKI